MLKVICVFIALSFYYIELSAQSLHFGKTVKEDGTPIPYANIIFLKNGIKEWQGSRHDIFHSDNEALNNFVFASQLYQEIRKVHK